MKLTIAVAALSATAVKAWPGNTPGELVENAKTVSGVNFYNIYYLGKGFPILKGALFYYQPATANTEAKCAEACESGTGNYINTIDNFTYPKDKLQALLFYSNGASSNPVTFCGCYVGDYPVNSKSYSNTGCKAPTTSGDGIFNNWLTFSCDRWKIFCYGCLEDSVNGGKLAPSSQPSSSSLPSSSTLPSSQPSSQPSNQPSGRPSQLPSGQPSSQPSRQPSSQPSGQPSQWPSGQPSSQPSISSQPSQLPSGQPSNRPTISSQPSQSPSGQPSVSLKPSGQPSQLPSGRPSRQPSQMPSSQPSGLPSQWPSTQPSTRPSISSSPSNGPSEAPSEQPSGQPSENPSVIPSSEPSETPSCTPSKAPTPSPSINLFYPDQSSSWESGCLNDGAQPSWMEQNPTIWLFSTLEKCCSRHFDWNYHACMGTLKDTCARALWYPDWDGDDKSCKRDGNEPYYMTANPAFFMFSTKADCCAEHYSYAAEVCNGNGVSSLASGNKWYADWTSGDDTCQNDGQAPQYMIDNMNLWLFDGRDACCQRYFGYKYADCMGGAVAAPSGRYFPNWEGDNEGCLVDSTTTPAPEYMASHAGGNAWLHATLDECCEQHYPYRVEECKSATAPASAGTGDWYIDWGIFACVKDCLVSSSDPDCGGLADAYGRSNLHNNKRICCNTHMSYDFKACFN